ncbi:hypothetical protein [Streptomyces xylophagus]|uniref:hypothetical protein n=1 Tax=Streptomyces xylophagus TaxID=285514 RepID=UPI00131DE0D9|nr:hypothetical protein [Streptomyces xylophagus]
MRCTGGALDAGVRREKNGERAQREGMPVGRLVQAWRNPAGAGAGPEPGRSCAGSSSPARDGG